MDFTKYNFNEATQTQYNEGLRSFLLKVYKHMSVGIAITAIVSYILGNNEAFLGMLYDVNAGKASLSGFGFLVQLAPLGFFFFWLFKRNKVSSDANQAMFWTYCLLVGASISAIFVAYSTLSIARAFLSASIMFGAMSIYGHTTKRDLTSFGHFFMMGLFGIIIASLLNLFIASSAVDFAISVVSVLVFLGLTAWNTQQLKDIYYHSSGSQSEEAMNNIAVFGALSLYLDFINLFLSLLRLMGSRRD